MSIGGPAKHVTRKKIASEQGTVEERKTCTCMIVHDTDICTFILCRELEHVLVHLLYKDTRVEEALCRPFSHARQRPGEVYNMYPCRVQNLIFPWSYATHFRSVACPGPARHGCGGDSACAAVPHRSGGYDGHPRSRVSSLEFAKRRDVGVACVRRPAGRGCKWLK